jgi:outer membrane murein-binding lipoprotein Lpp
MAEALKELLESDLLDENTKASIQSAWESNLTEARDALAIELREEFADRYENDKGQLVEAMDNMLTDAIKTEIAEFADDRKGLIEARVQYKQNVKEHTNALSSFVMEALKNEIVELREDRNKQFDNFNKLEGFVLKQLAGEIAEFNEDKKSLAEAKVKLIASGRQKLDEAKQNFIRRAATTVEKVVEDVLRNEMTQLKEDIKAARENNFGRKIFESFATEYMASYLAEGTTIRKLNSHIEKQEENITSLTESKDTADVEVKKLNNKINRDKIMGELLTPLAKSKRGIMEELLESVQTKNLKGSFQKYLPAVLNETGKRETSKVALTERTGDKVAPKEETQKDANSGNIIHLKKLAGIK